MSRFAHWISRSVGRIVEVVPDGPGPSEQHETAQPPSSIDPSPEKAVPEPGRWSRWLRRLAAAADGAEVLSVCAEEGASEFAASGCEIWVADGDATVLAGVWPVDHAARGGGLTTDARRLLEAGKVWTSRETDSSALLAAPLADGEEGSRAWMVLVRSDSSRPFGPTEADEIRQFAEMIGSFLRCVRKWDERRDTALRLRDNVIARQVQRGLLPHCPPHHPHLDICGQVQSGDAVGGCYLGYVTGPDGALGLTVLDVAGRGLDATLRLAGARGAIESQVRSATPPSALLYRVNEFLFGESDSTAVSATACHVQFDAEGHAAAYANAGHVPPFLLSSNGNMGFLDRSGPALGVLNSVEYPQGQLPLQPGDVLVVYTEGLIRARGLGGTPYGVDRLVNRVRRSSADPAAEIVRAVVQDLQSHSRRSSPEREFGLVVARVAPPTTAEEA
jgi:hypothetical protein